MEKFVFSGTSVSQVLLANNSALGPPSSVWRKHLRAAGELPLLDRGGGGFEDTRAPEPMG